MKVLPLRKKNRFSYQVLLLWYLIFFLISPLFSGFLGTIAIQTSFSLLLLSALFTLTESKKETLFGSVLAGISIAANAFVIFEDTFWTEFIALGFAAAFIAFVAASIFRNLFLRQSVEKDMVFGSICAYLLLATLWSLLYALTELILPGSFENVLPTGQEMAVATLPLKLHGFLYFSFVTQTTLGYGDIIPLTVMAKNLAALQAVMGVFYLATLVSGLVSLLMIEKKD